MKLFYHGVTRNATGDAATVLQRKGWIPVLDVQPDYNPSTQAIECGAVAVVDGVPTQSYSVRSLTSDELYQKAIDAGYDTGLGYRLALHDSDRSAFAQYSVLLKQGEELGQIVDEQEVPIKDMNGVMHMVTVAQYKQISFAYGMYYADLWARK